MEAAYAAGTAFPVMANVIDFQRVRVPHPCVLCKGGAFFRFNFKVARRRCVPLALDDLFSCADLFWGGSTLVSWLLESGDCDSWKYFRKWA